jgi:malate dehydrogenase (quinone)
MNKKYDVVLVGAGIMSATLGIMLKELMPAITIGIFERLDQVAAESSDAWNNAGTGHSAFCELNYTPQDEETGDVDIKKAIKVASQFEETKQFWSYLIENNILQNKDVFIHSIPHISFVWGHDNVSFLKKRHELLIKHTLFKDMKYSENRNTLMQWMPLVMEGRDSNEPMAATFMKMGTDVNFGALTREMIQFLDLKQEGVDVFLSHEIKDIKRHESENWELEIQDLKGEHTHHIFAKFVFIGAGGGALPLLEKSDIEEAEGYGGFPISGQWLKCTNTEIIAKHHTKVYGKAAVGSPPMSVPHLDTRVIDGKQELLFGPFAGFSTKFLKKGSYLDLPKSIEFDNIIPMISAGIHNLALTKYLIDQVRQSKKDRLNALCEYFPNAKMEDWELVIAGQRVQVIKKDEEEGGVLEFGTEIVSSADGTIAGLLGASPGASTAVSIMLNLLKTCFKDEFDSAAFQSKLSEMVPSYGISLDENETLLKKIRKKTSTLLGIN